jgi:hypothetical protein
MMEAICSSKASVLSKSARRHTPEDCILYPDMSQLLDVSSLQRTSGCVSCSHVHAELLIARYVGLVWTVG